ncbi:PPE family protein [Candidatus Mycobacterium methanotrophicum]|uniref:PPE family protein n=1 Tax=Candidatus Mycobacterium methanotrophicum TaxID=2943498 RepID=A0ABY4QST0_9MYCO|nr:PPE family protein [Candidatus Mycobacterium methanotrophicum]
MDFGALPPEINSGRIYSGPGSAPLLAAATAWDGLASELHSTAASYGSTISELASSGWQGPSSASMTAAAAPYTEWLSGTAAQAEQTASHAQAAAGAYEAAFAASVPPPLIAANRAQLAALVATNLLGQNTPAIAANEATYSEFWAQDAAAMYGYAGSSATASQLTSFTTPPTTTNDSGQATQSAAAANSAADSTGSHLESFLTELNTELTQWGTQITNGSTQLSTLETQLVNQLGTTVTLPTSLSSGIKDIEQAMTSLTGTINAYAAGPWTPIGIAGLFKSWWQASISIPNLGVGIQGIGPLINPKPIVGALSPLLHSGLLGGSYAAGANQATASAAAGRAGTIGSLSVPANWASAVPAVRTVATEMNASAVDAAPEMTAIAQNGTFGETALSSLAGRAIGGTATRAVARQAYRVPGAVAADEIAATATIIVIPPSSE